MCVCVCVCVTVNQPSSVYDYNHKHIDGGDALEVIVYTSEVHATVG